MSEKKEYIERGLVLEGKFAALVHNDVFDVVGVDDINAIPAADVEPVVRGEWQLLVSKWDRETDILLPPRNECSVCKNWIDSFKDYDFCPFCGAHMERSGSGE